MSKINEEIENLAKDLAKSNQEPYDRLVDLVHEMGPEGIRKAMPELNEEQRDLLKSVLEDAVNLKKAASFDAEAASASYYSGDIEDTKIQEDHVSDDVDETLVKPEGAIQYHQGTPTEGWSGQAVEDPEDVEAGQEVDTASNMVKSMKLEFTNIDEYYDDEDLLTLAKSFGNDYDVIEDFLNSDDDEFLDDLLEKGAKTVTRNGIRYYAEGKNAGKPVGSVRGDKDKASAYNKDDKDVQDAARKKLVDRKHPNREGSESKKTDERLKQKRAKMKKSEDMNLLKAMASDETMKKMMHKMMYEKGMGKKDCMAKMMEKGMDESRAKRLIDSAMEEHNKKMHGMSKSEGSDAPDLEKGKMKEKAMQGADSLKQTRKANETEMSGDAEGMLEEEDQISDGSEATEGVSRVEGQKRAPHDQPGKDNKAAQSQVNDLDQGGLKKSVVWKEDNLLRAGRGGQNHHASVNEYYQALDVLKSFEENPEPYLESASEVLEKAGQGSEGEALEKAHSVDAYVKKIMSDKHEVQDVLKEAPDEMRDDILAKLREKKGSMKKSEDLNEIIAKAEDCTWYDLQKSAELEKNEQIRQGKLVKSFEDNEIAQALGLSEEEAKKILGE
jgi:hypothetical protein